MGATRAQPGPGSASTDSHRQSSGTVGKCAGQSAAAPGSVLVIHPCPGRSPASAGRLSVLVRDGGEHRCAVPESV